MSRVIHYKISWWYGYWSDLFVESSSLRDCSDISASNLLSSGNYILSKISKVCGGCGEDEPTTVNEVDIVDFTIYPNPASGEFTVNLNSDEEVVIEIISILGQVVYASKIKSGNKMTVNLPEETYVVCIKSSDKVSQKKLVIEQ